MRVFHSGFSSGVVPHSTLSLGVDTMFSCPELGNAFAAVDYQLGVELGGAWERGPWPGLCWLWV